MLYCLRALENLYRTANIMIVLGLEMMESGVQINKSKK